MPNTPDTAQFSPRVGAFPGLLSGVPDQERPAESQLRKVATIALGVAVIVYLGSNLASARQSPELWGHWWWLCALTGRLVFGSGLIIAPWFVGTKTLRNLALAFAGFGLITVAASIPAIALGMTGVLRDTSLYAWGAALSMRPRWVWPYVVTLELTAFVARVLRGGQIAPIIESSLVSFTTMVLVVAIALGLIRSARLRDRLERAHQDAVIRDIGLAAAASERARLGSVAHDNVIATLRAISMGLSTPSADPRRMATNALERLAELEQPCVGNEMPITGVALVDRIRDLSQATAPGSTFSARINGDLTVPASVESAVADACSEALRNSVSHAARGRDVSRTVDVEIGSSTLLVSVRDEGDGFDLESVGAYHFGITRSIIARMASVRGGHARVESAPGLGTTVVLRWSP